MKTHRTRTSIALMCTNDSRCRRSTCPAQIAHRKWLRRSFLLHRYLVVTVKWDYPRSSTSRSEKTIVRSKSYSNWLTTRQKTMTFTYCRRRISLLAESVAACHREMDLQVWISLTQGVPLVNSKCSSSRSTNNKCRNIWKLLSRGTMLWLKTIRFSLAPSRSVGWLR